MDNDLKEQARKAAMSAASGTKQWIGNQYEALEKSVTPAERAAFWQRQRDPARVILWVLFLLGVAFGPIPTLFAILGFRRAFYRILLPQHIPPRLHPLDPASKYGLKWGFLIGIALMIGGVLLFGILARDFEPEAMFYRAQRLFRLLPFWVPYTIPASALLLIWFTNWANREATAIQEAGRFGSARFANDREFQRFQTKGDGFFIGAPLGGIQPLYYANKGHFLTVGGTRSGKGDASIIKNLLLDSLASSWVVIDPKGENALVTARALRNAGKKVVLLNPWNLFAEEFAARGFDTVGTFNPLALLQNSTPANLVDDVDILAEMIVPIPEGGKDDDHWRVRARAFVAGMILHLWTAPADKKHERTLRTIWSWLRLTDSKLEELILEMTANQHLTAGPVVQASGASMGTLKTTSSKEFASIMSTAARWTDFLKSPPLAKSIADSSFDLQTLADGDLAVFVIIPTDRIKTNSQWLRLVSTALMRAVVRRPKNRVTFLLDESYSLGYNSEIETLLGIGAGYNLSIWSIYQNLTQIKDLYGSNWENFLGSAAVRQFFGIGDQFSAEYLSKFLGTTTVLDISATGDLKGVQARPLLTPDEVRRGSKNIMFTFVEQEFPIDIEKTSYRASPTLASLADPNPYHGGFLAAREGVSA